MPTFFPFQPSELSCNLRSTTIVLMDSRKIGIANAGVTLAAFFLEEMDRLSTEGPWRSSTVPTEIQESGRLAIRERRIVLANLLRKLDTRAPWLGTLLGNRLDLEVPAYMVSLTVHALFLVLLALAGHRVHQVVQREFRSQVLDSALSASESTFPDRH